MNIMDSKLYSIEAVKDLYLREKIESSPKENASSGLTFEEILSKKTIEDNEHVKFSKHANARLESRNISLSDSQKVRLDEGVNMAREKSINESLVMMDNMAFIVNIKNNTVVTALVNNEEKNVFTNIDGAVIV